jgi:hypothetical protein
MNKVIYWLTLVGPVIDILIGAYKQISKTLSTK